MNDQHDFERIVADSVRSIGPVAPSDGAHDLTRSRVRRSRQDPEWLALIKEPPMRSNSHPVVGSPTVRVVAIMAATVLLALALAAAGVAGSRILAADDLIVVDQSGAGTTTTIADAVARAQDGDEILVRPGVYQESITITEGITLRGEDRANVIIEFGSGCEDGAVSVDACPPDMPTYPFWYGEGPFAILVTGGDAQISDLTIRGPEELEATGSIVASGDGPSFHDITVEGLQPMYIDGGSSASVSSVDISDAPSFVIEPSTAVVENGRFLNLVVNSSTGADDGPGPVLRGNHTHGITLEAPATVERNEVVVPDEPVWEEPTYGSGIDVIEGATFVIRDNVVSGFASDWGINAVLGSVGEITGNTVTDSRIGIAVGIRSETTVNGNAVSDSGAGYVLNGTVEFSDNTAEGITGHAVTLGAQGTYRLSGNRACDNGVDLKVLDGAEVTMQDGNEFCVIEAPE